MPTKICLICAKPFEVVRARATSAKYCSTQCRDIGLRKLPNQTCSVCGKAFHIKKSQFERYNRTLGVFCSNTCLTQAKQVAYLGEKNPNFKNRNTDQDGYRIVTPQAPFLLGMKRMKLHQAVCCEILGIPKIPKGFHIHHRDCDVLNNTAENLVVLSTSDHKWIHKQYGNATLWALCNNRCSIEDLVAWSDDAERARNLLSLTVSHQVPTFTKE